MKHRSIASLLFTVLLGSLTLCSNACQEAKPPGVCGGENRPPLDCSAEFKYDDRMVKGGFSVYNVGVNLETESKALREVDQATAKYVAQFRRLCDEYNKCVIDKDTYATRSENMRRRMEKVPELLDGVQNAKGGSARAKAVAMAYDTLIPDEEKVELSMDFSVVAQRPSDANAVPIRAGTSLVTGTRVNFTIKVSRTAYVYLFQKSPDGSVNVLFPDKRISVNNPLPGNQALRIPPGTAAFKLNEKDVGEEKVFLAASLQPIASLQQAAQQLASGGKAAVVESLSTVQSGAQGANCNTRALEYDEGTQPACVRSRGLELEDTGAESSMRMRTEAGDSTIVGIFSFQHTK